MAKKVIEKEKTYTLTEILTTFMPNGVLDRLHTSLIESLGITQDWQHRYSPNEDSRLTGYIEVAKMDWRGIKDIRRIIQNHYVLEGFTLASPDEETFMHFVRDELHITVYVSESATSWPIHITETSTALR